MKMIKLTGFNAKNILLGGICISLLGGCAAHTQPKVAEAPSGLSAEEFHAKMAEFEQMKPSLQRLAALEPELKALISQLTQIAEAAEMQEAQNVATTDTESQISLAAEDNVEANADDLNVAIANNGVANKMLTVDAMTDSTFETDVDEIVNPTVVTTAVDTNGVKPMATPAMGQYTLQLTAVTDKGKIKQSWHTLQKTYSPELDDMQAIYQEVELSGVTFYRIKAGYYSSQQQAKQGCIVLKKMGANCIVSNNTGFSVIY
ncbi:SPOR domain-containing protein [uncultured Paraglaciecola sp.]|uniref:SPOR domain-containing protein n=1 Tax=uncultured Paraglaciecola sp. TaxID=1765024 RepID=UPI0030DA1ECC|tara:strand:+ start:1075 stop:1854 length:780 start_codon:yes stop_codon:yes gene_type:complete